MSNNDLIVMNIRYVGKSEINAVSRHEINRHSNGYSNIDVERSNLNEVLVGAETQAKALEDLLNDGVEPHTKQAERPYVQFVLSASPTFFRDPNQGPGEWNQKKLDVWKQKTLEWMKNEYGEDLIHVSLHLDEETPHFHALVVPTYQKKRRKPGKMKRNETHEEFQQRIKDSQESPTVRRVGRASNTYWKQMRVRMIARKSYHKGVESLGLGYGQEFAGSKDAKTTKQHILEKSAELERREKDLEEKEEKAKKVRSKLLENAKIINETEKKIENQKIEFSKYKIEKQREISKLHRNAVSILDNINELFTDFKKGMAVIRKRIQKAKSQPEKAKAKAQRSIGVKQTPLIRKMIEKQKNEVNELEKLIKTDDLSQPEPSTDEIGPSI